MFARYLKNLENFCDELVVQLNPRIATVFPYKNYQSVLESGATHALPFGELGRFLDHIPSGQWLETERVPHSGLKIGVTWSGSKTHGNNARRSTTPQLFKKLSQYGELFTLNPAEWGTKGFTSMRSSDWAGSLRDIGKLDFVVSVDTSIVHLCGSAGVPCLMLQPEYDTDFRWGDPSMGIDNVWYSSVRVVRNDNNWDKCMSDACKLIEEEFWLKL